MGLVTLPTTFVDGTVPTAAQFNGDFTAITNEFNGNITNANISASAAIDTSKISGTAINSSSNQSITGRKTFAQTVQTITAAADGATVTFNLSLGNIHQVTLGGNRTLAVSNVQTGDVFVVILIQDSTGSRTVTWFSDIVWTGNTVPTLTTQASRQDVFVFIYNGSKYLGLIGGQNLPTS